MKNPSKEKKPGGATEKNAGEVELRETAHKLGERVKELNCLYGISGLVEDRDSTVEEILQQVVVLIPPAWQYPEATCACIKLKDGLFKTANFVETDWKQADTITVNGDWFGTVEVYYLVEKPQSDEGPFLKEERNLMHVIAERLGNIIEHKLAEKRLQELYLEEKDLRKRLQAEIQGRVAFTRNLIHELKTPLTSLIATSQLLLEEEHDKKLEKLAKYVWEGASSLNNRIDELHDVIKGEIGKLKLELKPIDLGKLLLSIADETKALARVRQIVLNLLNNAFRYAAEGRQVNIGVIRQNGFALVEVSDRGPGIAPSAQKHLFISGYHHPRDVENSVGLGIGLSLCKLLVELHGGKIWVKSRRGKGASFFFTLPLYVKS